MPQGRPGSYTTLAVMNFIVGGLSLLCSVCGGIDLEMTVNNRNITPEMKQFLNQEIPGYSAYRITGMVVGLAVGIGLIIAGIGLLQVTQWGRFLAISCSAVGLLHHIALVVLQLFYVNPALTRFFAGLGPFNMSFMPKTVALFGMLEQGLAGVYFLVQILVLAFHPPRSFAYRPEDDDWQDQRRRPPRRDRDDRDYDDPPRRPRRRGGDWED